ncbi:putative P450 monooxygenase [Ilyonectria destructans]|nr:putative P450 monooxygenase [Ilyonectria destructans]
MRIADYVDSVWNVLHARGWSTSCQVAICTDSLIDVLSAAYWKILLALFLGLSGILLQTRYRRGLRNLPGPFLASISSLPRVVTAFGGQQFLKHAEYHKTYGPMVRVGPNHVSIADSQCISQIYSITSKFYKSNFYVLFDADTGTAKVPTVFSVRSQSMHKTMKRPIANAYSMSSMIELEPAANACTEIFERKLQEKQGAPIDLGTWLHWYAFDLITSITFSNRLGFMEKETDVDDIIDSIEGRLAYNSVVGQAPWLHNFLLGNRLFKSIATRFKAVAKLNTAQYIVNFAAEQLLRYNNSEKPKEIRDMLSRFKTMQDGESLISDNQLLAHTASNIFAGSDTTAISLRAIIYYLCKNPTCYKKVLAEIDDMDSRGELSNPVTFTEVSKMTYYHACMKEAMRLHPSCGQMLERVVPEGGATLSGAFLPQGTIVGVNPWVIGRDKAVYGENADDFVPERWLNNDAVSLKAMERNFFAFGAGSRSCLGKNVSLMEMSKLVPQLLRNFQFELENPNVEWKLTGYWFVKQTGLICRVSQRKVF